MRVRTVAQGLTVNAIAGSYVVVLGLNINDADRAGLRGFAIQREDMTEDETFWMKGMKTFQTVEPNPAAGEQFSSLVHPLQTFQWADYSAKPGYTYVYKVVAMTGNPSALQQRASASVTVTTENIVDDHTIHFNRGAAASQEYARRFQNKAPSQVGQAAYDWLNGKFVSKGTLPVSVCNYKAGDGKIVYEDEALPFAAPVTLNINDSILYKVDSIANNAIYERAFPGCVVLAAKDGKVFFDKAYGYMAYDSIAPMKTNTIFDLASVTKISATNVSIMKLYEEGKIGLNKTLGDYLPWVAGTDKANLVIGDILLHQAGLQAFIPFYKETIDTLTGIPKPGFFRSMPDDSFNIEVADTMYMRHDWRDTMYARILQSPLTKQGDYIYSDNDFIFLGKVVEQLTGKTLDAYVKETFYDPMQMHTTGFHPEASFALSNVAPTEREKMFRLQQLRGTVHDPGSAMFGGVAGHAGLFSDAYDLAKLYQMLLNGGTYNGKEYLKKETIDYFTAYHSEHSRRGYGFDKPEKDNATRKEPYPSKLASSLTYGHTGYTGICVWVDPAYNLVYIFLSNRVYPDGGVNTRIGKLNVRGAIQDVFYEAIKKSN